ncbi:MAG TPA: hypothetical protein VNK82_14155 [Terriglobales bacterium]|nr:hypothetical protein [Terriglobales bacterium]
MDRTLLYITSAAVAIAGSAAAVSWFRRRKTPEQRERERRQRLVATGRIIDGTILDVHEVPSTAGPLQLLVYRYDVRGVSYEASQDVTHLRQYLDLHSCRIGVPAAVKYDPHNPGDSIVIAEGWSGLRS